jgi:type VI protein secretion system component VasF
MRNLLRLATLGLAMTLGAAQAPITKEALEARIADLTKQYEQAVANANAIQGAIQDCKYWLGELDKTPAPAPAAKGD